MKRITLFSGHYGSGKTNIAVNYAMMLKKRGKKTTIVDLDIVNPYFRTKDSEKILKDAGIELVCSEYANTNLDAPALPKEIYSVIADKDLHIVIDVGGDDRGALALGRYAPDIIKENNFDMLFVANCYRPLTKTAEDALGVMREIEGAAGMRFTGIVNNSNLGEETSADDIKKSEQYIKNLEKLSGLKCVFTCAESSLDGTETIDNLFKLELQERYFQIRRG